MIPYNWYPKIYRLPPLLNTCPRVIVVKAFPRVLVMGYGVIGKRVVDAILKQDDMKLVGVGDLATDWRIKMAVRRGVPVYAALSEKEEEMRKAGIPVEGSVEDLIRKGDVDIIVDATPKGIGALNKKKLYEPHGIKAVFEGGEKHEIAQASFVAQRNYSEAIGKDFVRVVSCNTTAICRVVGGLHEKIGLRKARVTIVRRAVDVWESHKTGIMNTVVPELKIPSHHGPDAKTVMKDLDIVTMAFKGSHNLYHMHAAFLEARERVSRDRVIEALENEKRVVFIRGKDGVEALNSIFELARDLGRERGDLYEIPVWEDAIKVEDKEIYLIWATPNESNVIPENIDAIRAATELETNALKSIEKTDRALGVLKRLY
jgi:glyceraldehyde-3-phosphate dehydrogenase (NAD(P))